MFDPSLKFGLVTDDPLIVTSSPALPDEMLVILPLTSTVRLGLLYVPATTPEFSGRAYMLFPDVANWMYAESMKFGSVTEDPFALTYMLVNTPSPRKKL